MLEQAVLIGLAAWRLTALMSYERGPFDLFIRLRVLLAFSHNERGEPYGWRSSLINDIIACPWCLGLWMAGAMYGLWQLEPMAVVAIAASTIMVAVERWNRPNG